MVNGLGDIVWDSDKEISKFEFQGTGTVITSATDTFENCILLKYEFLAARDFKYACKCERNFYSQG